MSNTPLRELIQHIKIIGFGSKGKEQDDASVPDLDVYIIDVWPTIEKNVPWIMMQRNLIEKKIYY